MFWDGFPGQIIVNTRNLGPECQKVTPTEVKVDGPARAHPGVTRTCEQYIIYLLLCAEKVSVVKNRVASVFKKLNHPDTLPYLKIRQGLRQTYIHHDTCIHTFRHTDIQTDGQTDSCDSEVGPPNPPPTFRRALRVLFSSRCPLATMKSSFKLVLLVCVVRNKAYG